MQPFLGNQQQFVLLRNGIVMLVLPLVAWCLTVRQEIKVVAGPGKDGLLLISHEPHEMFTPNVFINVISVCHGRAWQK